MVSLRWSDYKVKGERWKVKSMVPTAFFKWKVKGERWKVWCAKALSFIILSMSSRACRGISSLYTPLTTARPARRFFDSATLRSEWHINIIPHFSPFTFHLSLFTLSVSPSLPIIPISKSSRRDDKITNYSLLFTNYHFFCIFAKIMC